MIAAQHIVHSCCKSQRLAALFSIVITSVCTWFAAFTTKEATAHPRTAPISSANIAKPLYSDIDIKHAKAAMEIAQKSDLAYALVASLTTEVGARPAGSKADAKAVEWAKKKLEAMGFDRVWTEPVKVNAWQRVGSHGDLITPYHHHLTTAALGNSVSTPNTGITAEIAYYANFDALKKDTSERARGKIVFIDGEFAKSIDGRGYGSAVGARVYGAIEAGRRGALAVVIRSVGTSHDRLAHTGTMFYDEKITPPIPAAAVSTPDAALIRRIATSETNATPMTMYLNMKNIVTPDVESQNVFAEWRGDDKNKSAQIVAIGGHLDSWDMGTGAIDDGAGVAITMAAMKILRDMGVRPRRTIRIILFANEENGLDGARAYAEKYGHEKHQLVSESDLGAGRIYALNTGVDASTRPWLQAIADIIAPLGAKSPIAIGHNTANGGPDFGPLVSRFQHPAASLAQDATDYFDYHHTANDTLDKIEPLALKQNLTAWVAMIWLAAQAEHDFKGAKKAP
jgi:carboxypeptidase Q